MSKANYTLIKKNTNKDVKLPSDIVRVRGNSTGLSIAANVARRFLDSSYTTPLGHYVKIRIEVDKESKKIRLTPSSDGFSFSYSPSGILSLSAAPKQLREVGMPSGDYISRNNGNTFVFVQ